MPWIKIDDHFDEHPKLAAVSPVGWGVWLAGLAYCNRNLTDGFIPYAVAEGIGGAWKVRVPVEDDEDGNEVVWSIDRGSGMHGESMDTQWVIDLLLRVGLWTSVVGGYRVHDYEDYQPTKAQVLADRAAKVAAGRASVRARVAARGGTGAPTGDPAPPPTESKPVPVPTPVPVPDSTPPSENRSPENSPPTPPQAGGQPSRANGTNPRSRHERAAAAAEEERQQLRLARREIHQRYLRGEINEDQERELYDDLGKQPDDLTRKVPA